MKYFSTDLDGVTLIEPDQIQMRQILESVASSNEDYPEVFLTHQTGMTISYRHGGILVREVNEEVTGTLPDVSLGTALETWQWLASGDHENLEKLPWSKPPDG